MIIKAHIQSNCIDSIFIQHYLSIAKHTSTHTHTIINVASQKVLFTIGQFYVTVNIFRIHIGLW